MEIHDLPREFTIAEVASLFRVTRKAISRWRDAGKLHGRRADNGRWIFDREEINPYLAYIDSDNNLLTAREVGGLYNASYETVKQWARAGKMRAVVLPNETLRFPERAIKEHMGDFYGQPLMTMVELARATYVGGPYAAKATAVSYGVPLLRTPGRQFRIKRSDAEKLIAIHGSPQGAEAAHFVLGDLLTVSDVRKRLRVKRNTVVDLEKRGVLVAVRTPRGTRRILASSLRGLLGEFIDDELLTPDEVGTMLGIPKSAVIEFAKTGEIAAVPWKLRMQRFSKRYIDGLCSEGWPEKS